MKLLIKDAATIKLLEKASETFVAYDIYLKRPSTQCLDCGQSFMDKPPSQNEICKHTNVQPYNLGLTSGVTFISKVTKQKDKFEITIPDYQTGALRNLDVNPDKYKVEFRPYKGRASNVIISTLHGIENELNEMFPERSALIELMISTIISSSNIVLYGKPGVAKTQLIETFMKYIIEDRPEFKHYNRSFFFNLQMNKFTEKNNLFGEINMHRLIEYSDPSTSITPLSNSILTSTVACLDEIFKGSGPALQTLLSMAQQDERKFTEGENIFYSNLSSIVSASNEEPDKMLQALSDRFTVKYCVNDVEQNAVFAAIIEHRMTGKFANLTFAETDTMRLTLDELNYIKSYNKYLSRNVNDAVAKEISLSFGDLREQLNASISDDSITTRKYTQATELIIAYFHLKIFSTKTALTPDTIIYKPKMLTIMANALWNKVESSKDVRGAVYLMFDPSKFELDKLVSEFSVICGKFTNKLRNGELDPKGDQYKKEFLEIKNTKDHISNKIKDMRKNAEGDGLSTVDYDLAENILTQNLAKNISAFSVACNAPRIKSGKK